MDNDKNVLAITDVFERAGVKFAPFPTNGELEDVTPSAIQTLSDAGFHVTDKPGPQSFPKILIYSENPEYAQKLSEGIQAVGKKIAQHDILFLKETLEAIAQIRGNPYKIARSLYSKGLQPPLKAHSLSVSRALNHTVDFS